MAELDDYDFTKGDAGASHVYNDEAGQIRVGGYVDVALAFIPISFI